jgi:SPP1 family predicted phage head-tail adaptor
MAKEIADLRHRVIIQEKQKGDATATGGSAVDWVALWEDVPAAIRQLYAKEYDLARQHHAEATHKITIRYRKNVTGECRIVFGKRIFNIVGHPNNLDERNFWLEITVTEET